MTPEEAEKWKRLFAQNKIDSVVAVAVRTEFSQIRADIKADMISLIAGHLKPTFLDALRANKAKFGAVALGLVALSGIAAIYATSTFSGEERMKLIQSLMDKAVQAASKCKP